MPEDEAGWGNGISFDVKGVRLLFDPSRISRIRGPLHVMISHAHSDHTYGFTSKVSKYSTMETVRIYEALRKCSVDNCRTVKVGEKVHIDDVDVKVLNAGHMFGSCQFQIFAPEYTAIYTGDINCVDTLTTTAADVDSCDLLVMEATYGHPSYRFPQRSSVYADIVNWAVREIHEGKTPTFQAYSSGKSQDLIRLFNVYTRIPVVCSPAIARASRIHDVNGCKLEFMDSSEPDASHYLRKGGCVYITTPRSPKLPVKTSLAVTTGWALRYRFRQRASFPLSSHADYTQLLSFVERVKPEKICLFAGQTEAFSEEVERMLRIPARALPAPGQSKLADF